jgi:hypothetical protein
VQLLLPLYVRTGVWFSLLQMSFGSFFLLHFTGTSRGWQCYYASVNGKESVCACLFIIIIIIIIIIIFLLLLLYK